MQFRQTAYSSDGDINLLLFDDRSPVRLDVDVAVEGDFMSTERTLDSHFVSNRANGGSSSADASRAQPTTAFSTSRFGCRRFTRPVSSAWKSAISDRHGKPRPIRSRGRGGPGEVAEKGERDSVAAFARLAIDRGGHETDEILEACLPIIADVHDCADFLLVPLLWCRMAWPERIGAATRTRIDATVLGFRYWMDEPGNDVMWYFSENHALLYSIRRATSPGRFSPTLRSRGQAAPGGSRRRSGANGCSIGSLISKPARWQSGTPPLFPYRPQRVCARFTPSRRTRASVSAPGAQSGGLSRSSRCPLTTG